MSRTHYVAGVTLTIAGSIVFYSWVLHRVFEMPAAWVVSIMLPTAVICTVTLASTYSYWLPVVQPNGIKRRSPAVPAGRLGLYMFVVSVPTWSAGFLIWRGYVGAALLSSFIAAALALLVFRRLARSHRAASSRLGPDQNADALTHYGLPFGWPLIRGVQIVLYASLPAMFAIFLVMWGEFAFGVPLLAVGIGVFAWAIRKTIASRP
jgi:hypothetical protein